jgi:hypothetical protein
LKIALAVDHPNPVLSSQKTIVEPRRATMSISLPAIQRFVSRMR